MFYKGIAPKWKSKSAPRAQECSDRKMLKSQSPRTEKVDSNGVDLDDWGSGEKSAIFAQKCKNLAGSESGEKSAIFALLSPSGENQCVWPLSFSPPDPLSFSLCHFRLLETGQNGLTMSLISKCRPFFLAMSLSPPVL